MDALVGIGTLALALATVWLALEQRRTRLHAERRRVRTLLRAAVAEQLENMRRLHPRDPSRGQPALIALRDSGPTFDSLRRLVEELDLPPDLAAYLIWLVGDAQQRWSAFRGLLDDLAPIDGSAPVVHATH